MCSFRETGSGEGGTSHTARKRRHRSVAGRTPKGLYSPVSFYGLPRTSSASAAAGLEPRAGAQPSAPASPVTLWVRGEGGSWGGRGGERGRPVVCVCLAIGTVPSGVCSPRRPRAGERKDSLELQAPWAISRWPCPSRMRACLAVLLAGSATSTPVLRGGAPSIAEGSLTERAGDLQAGP